MLIYPPDIASAIVVVVVVIVVVSNQLALVAFGSLLVVYVCVYVWGARYENIKNQFNEPFKLKYFQWD